MFSSRSPEGQTYMIDKIQNPGKQIIRQLVANNFGISDLPKLVGLLRDLAHLPEPVKSGEMESNTLRLIDAFDDFFNRFNVPAYLNIFRPISYFIIHKYHTDKFYHDGLNDIIGGLIKRGWEFNKLDNPPSKLWDSGLPKTRAKLISTLQSHYKVMQDKCKNLTDEAKKEKFLKQFFDRLLDTIDQEVILWK